MTHQELQKGWSLQSVQPGEWLSCFPPSGSFCHSWGREMNPGLYNDSSLELFSSSAHPEFPHLGNYVRKLRHWESDLTPPSLARVKHRAMPPFWPPGSSSLEWQERKVGLLSLWLGRQYNTREGSPTSIIPREKIEKSKVLQKFVRSKHIFFSIKTKWWSAKSCQSPRQKGNRIKWNHACKVLGTQLGT